MKKILSRARSRLHDIVRNNFRAGFRFNPVTLLLVALLVGTLGTYLLLRSRAAAPSVTTVKSGSWSDATVWSTGTVPTATEQAVISTGQTVTLNTDTKVTGLVVNAGATLAFDPSKSVTLESDAANVIVHGTLVMKPSGATINHTLRFINVDESKFVGGGMDPLDTDVGLWVMGDGVLDIAGTPKKGWTNVTDTIAQGATTIQVKDATGWRVGDEIVITPTRKPTSTSDEQSWKGFHEAAITSISGNTITLSKSTVQEHPKVNNKWTAEVMNLTRNVRFEGTGHLERPHPDDNGRAHIFIRSTKPQSVKHAAIRFMGPRRYTGSTAKTEFGSDDPLTSVVLGRYSLHFHHAGDGARGSVVEGTVVRLGGGHSYVPHASHGVTLKDCVSYNTYAPAIWWDPDEQSGFEEVNASHDTLVDGCIVGIVRHHPTFRGYGLEAFSLARGLRNEIRNSVAVGVNGAKNASGFEWPHGTQRVGGSGVWEFSKNNLAHNNGGNGIFVWQNNSRNHVISDFYAYHNRDSGILNGAYGNRYQYKNVELVGNGVYAIDGQASTSATEFRDDGYGQVFEGVKTDGNLGLGHHVFRGDFPLLFKDCYFPKVVVIAHQEYSKYDFVNCGKEPANFDLRNPLPGMLARVQRPNNTAFSIDHTGKVEAIPPFYGLTINSQMPAVFSDNWTGANGSAWNSDKWTAQSGSGAIDIQGNRGRLYFSTGYAKAMAKMPKIADTDLVTKVQFDSTGTRGHLRFVLRGSGDWVTTDTPTSGYEIHRRSDSDTAYLYAINSGQRTELGKIHWLANTTDYWLRFRIKGNDIKVRKWHVGKPEPSIWHLEATDSSVQNAGILQVGYYREGGTRTTFLDDMTIYDSSAPIIYNTDVADITNNTATIRWYTDVPATSQVEYGTAPCPCSKQTNLATGQTVIHNVGLTSLSSGTTYYYRVKSTGANGKTAIGPTQTFATTGATTNDTTPPTAPTALSATAPDHTKVNLSWTAATDNVGVTGYNVYRSDKGLTPIGTVSGTTLSYTDTTVSPSTTYSYWVTAVDAAGNSSTLSNEASVTTPADPTVDTTAPAVSITAPAEGATVSGTVNVTVDATDNVGVSQVEFFVNGTLMSTDTSSPYGFSWDSTTVRNGSHSLSVRAVDTTGNAASDAVSVAVQNGDTTPPTAPTALSATAPDHTKVNLSWTAATDDVGVTGYWVIRNGVTIAQTDTTTSYTDTSVKASTQYTYQVAAFDAAGNTSTLSNEASVTTPAAPDTTAPTAPTDLTATTASHHQINLSWSASTDNVGVSGYDVYRNGSRIATVTTTSFGDSNLAAATTYSYTVVARDAAGNQSAHSNTASATTAPAPTSTGALTGQVGSSRDGILVGAKVSTDINGSRHTVTTNGDGLYFMADLPPNSYGVKYDYKQHRYQIHTVSITAGNTTTKDVTLEPTKRGDLNGDGSVSVLDLSMLLSNWGSTDRYYDLSGDDLVNIVDLSILLSSWTSRTTLKTTKHTI